MEIIDNKLYKPRDIAEQALILNTKGKQDYWYILHLIRKGVLKAIDKGTGKTSHYMVNGTEIKRYKREVEGIEV
jgi:hypothetical protein